MLSRLLSKKPPKPAPAIPEGQRIYAIGDIHGRDDLLEELLSQIDADDRQRPPADTQIILLGDLIDRGPASAQTVERVRQLLAREGRFRVLLGNHEEVFLKALNGDLKALSFFTRIGGRDTIFSYGISEEEYLASDYPELLTLLQSRVPAEHLNFLENLEDMIIVGDYVFVHAGIRPQIPLAEQKISDLRWIRSEFLEHRGGFEKVVVHGHTISDQVEFTPMRIGLDTGAYASGRLSAVCLEGIDQRLIQTKA